MALTCPSYFIPPRLLRDSPWGLFIHAVYFQQPLIIAVWHQSVCVVCVLCHKGVTKAERLTDWRPAWLAHLPVEYSYERYENSLGSRGCFWGCFWGGGFCTSKGADEFLWACLPSVSTLCHCSTYHQNPALQVTQKPRHCVLLASGYFNSHWGGHYCWFWTKFMANACIHLFECKSGGGLVNTSWTRSSICTITMMLNKIRTVHSYIMINIDLSICTHSLNVTVYNTCMSTFAFHSFSCISLLSSIELLMHAYAYRQGVSYSVRSVRKCCREQTMSTETTRKTLIKRITLL